MDIFKQKRNLVITIIVLVILNILTLTLLWIGRPAGIIKGPRGPEDREHIQRLLKEELGFNEEQAKKYVLLREEHRNKTESLNKEIREIKRQMFDEALQIEDQTNLSDSLLNLAQEKQAKLETITFKHFLALKELCAPEQRKGLRKLMHKLLGPPQLPGHEGPPPPTHDHPLPEKK